MRTHVGKMLVGPGAAATAANPTAGVVYAMPWAAIQKLLTDAQPPTMAVAAASDEFGFVKMDSDGNFLKSGPFKSAGSLVDSNPFTASTQQKSTLTVDVTDLVDGKGYIVKVVYHDNLSIVPNQMKFTTISVVFTAGMTSTQWATAIAAEFNKQDYLFVTVTSAAAVVTFEGIVLLTASKYNRIDRPETVVFEVGVGDMTYGSYPTGSFIVANTVPVIVGQGSAAQTAWLEDQNQGRRGYSDRIYWGDTKKFQPSAIDGTTYNTVIITANDTVEGDMQDTRDNPIGATIATESGGGTTGFLADLNTIIDPNVANVIEHPVDS